MTVWVQEAYYAFAFFGLLSGLLIAPWIHLQYRRFGAFRGWPAIVSALTVLYGCALLAFTMFPLPRETPGYCAKHAGRSYWQFMPFASLDDVLAYAGTHSFLQTLTSGVVLQVLMNVVFFVPLGFLLAYRYDAGWWRTVATSLGLSLAIELTQGTGIWGLAECPYRLADIDDLMTNTLGGTLGWLLARAISRYLPDPHPSPRTDEGVPSLRRRALAVLLDLQVTLVIVIGVLAIDERRGDAPNIGSRNFTMLTLAATLALFVVLPMLWRSRATPGQAAVLVTLCHRHGRPSPRHALIVRWAIQWLPFVFGGIALFAAILAIDLLVAWRRADGRSLTDLVSRTCIRTGKTGL